MAAFHHLVRPILGGQSEAALQLVLHWSGIGMLARERLLLRDANHFYAVTNALGVGDAPSLDSRMDGFVDDRRRNPFGRRGQHEARVEFAKPFRGDELSQRRAIITLT